MNLVIKSFVVALLAVSSVNAASIRGIRQAPSWWSTHDAVEACTSIGTNRECSRCATDGLRLCLNNSDEDAAVCDRFFENTINRCQRLTSNNEAAAEATAEASNFVQVQNGEGDRCRFPFPNCGNGLVCVNRLNDDPVCHRRGECYPRGFKAPSSGFHEFAVCCSNTGANGHCL